LRQRRGEGRTGRECCDRRRIGKDAKARRHAGRGARTPRFVRRPRGLIGRNGRVLATDRRSRRGPGCGQRCECEPREYRLQGNGIGGKPGGEFPAKSSRCRRMHDQGSPLPPDYHSARNNSMRPRRAACGVADRKVDRRPTGVRFAERLPHGRHPGCTARHLGLSSRVNAKACDPRSSVMCMWYMRMVCAYGHPYGMCMLKWSLPTGILFRSVNRLIGNVASISDQTIRSREWLREQSANRASLMTYWPNSWNVTRRN
jgi:hypothetical protein